MVNGLLDVMLIFCSTGLLTEKRHDFEIPYWIVDDTFTYDKLIYIYIYLTIWSNPPLTAIGQFMLGVKESAVGSWRNDRKTKKGRILHLSTLSITSCYDSVLAWRLDYQRNWLTTKCRAVSVESCLSKVCLILIIFLQSRTAHTLRHVVLAKEEAGTFIPVGIKFTVHLFCAATKLHEVFGLQWNSWKGDSPTHHGVSHTVR